MIIHSEEDWRCPIGQGEITRFIQNGADSAVLNRVTTGNSSEILGSLVSNGHVFLINPAGILVGRDGSVVGRYPSSVGPDDEALGKAIEGALKK